MTGPIESLLRFGAVGAIALAAATATIGIGSILGDWAIGNVDTARRLPVLTALFLTACTGVAIGRALPDWLKTKLAYLLQGRKAQDVFKTKAEALYQLGNIEMQNNRGNLALSEGLL